MSVINWRLRILPRVVQFVASVQFVNARGLQSYIWVCCGEFSVKVAVLTVKTVVFVASYEGLAFLQEPWILIGLLLSIDLIECALRILDPLDAQIALPEQEVWSNGRTYRVIVPDGTREAFIPRIVFGRFGWVDGLKPDHIHPAIVLGQMIMMHFHIDLECDVAVYVLYSGVVTRHVELFIVVLSGAFWNDVDLSGGIPWEFWLNCAFFKSVIERFVGCGWSWDFTCVGVDF